MIHAIDAVLVPEDLRADLREMKDEAEPGRNKARNLSR